MQARCGILLQIRFINKNGVLFYLEPVTSCDLIVGMPHVNLCDYVVVMIGSKRSPK